MKLRSPCPLLAILTAAVGLMVSPNQAPASVTLSFEQVGDDVVATYSGSWSSWEGSNFDSNLSERIFERDGVWWFNEKGNIWQTSVTKPTGWSNRAPVSADSVSGDAFGFRWDVQWLYAPFDYVAGQSLEGSMTFSDKTFGDLDFTEGDSGTISTAGGTINYTVGAIPEPSSYGFLLGAVGLATAIFCRRRRARTE